MITFFGLALIKRVGQRHIYIYKQTADIDATDTQDWNNGLGFSPIGSSQDLFKGIYDGQNYTIFNLYINRPYSSFIGLFGKIYMGSQINNLIVENVNITGGNYVGGMIGYGQECYIHNDKVTGIVTGINYVGGFIGYLEGWDIINCFSNCSVTGNSSVGGFCGYNGAEGKIKSCDSEGSVDGSSQVGGFVGYNGMKIFNCFSRSDVIGESFVGGFCGKMASGYSPHSSTHLSSSYSIGRVSGTNNVGGFIGDVNITENTRVDGFWDINTSQVSESSAGIGKTTIEMRDVATYTDTSNEDLAIAWDFVDNPNDDNGTGDYWNISSSINSGYPFIATSNFLGTNGETIHSIVSSNLTNHPNPFNPTTTISFDLTQNSNIEIEIFNVKGQKVKTVTDGNYSKGSNSVVWNGDDESNNPVSSGIYFYNLNVDGVTKSRKKYLLLK